MYNVEKRLVVNSTKKEVFPMSILQQVPDKMRSFRLSQMKPPSIVDSSTGSALTQILVFGWLENPEASSTSPKPLRRSV